MPGCKDLILQEKEGGGHPAGQELQGGRASPTPSPITSKRRLPQHAHSRCSLEPVLQISQTLSRCLVALQEVAFAPAYPKPDFVQGPQERILQTTCRKPGGQRFCRQEVEVLPTHTFLWAPRDEGCSSFMFLSCAGNPSSSFVQLRVETEFE